MAKTTEVISDFSGGIVKGYAEENLKNNQLTDCNNLIADGVGKINTIPNTLSQSASDFNVNLPSAKGKNIHRWSTDINLINVNSQETLSDDGVTITEIQKGRRAKLILYFSPLDITNDNIQLKIKDSGRQETIIDWSLNGTILNADTYDFDDVEKKEFSAIHQVELNAHSDNQNNDLEYKDIINWKWLETTETSDVVSSNETSAVVSWSANDTELNNTTTGNRYNNIGYLHKITNANWGSNPFYRIIAQFDYYGTIPFTHETSNMIVISALSDDTLLTWNDTNNPAISYRDFNSSDAFLAIDGQAPYSFFAYNDNENNLSNNKYFGQFAKWEYKLPSIPINKSRDYSLEIVFFTNASQSTTQSISVTYSQELGQNAYDVRTGLFNLLQTKIENEYPDYELAWADNGEAVVFRQYEGTNKAYGISAVNSTLANEVTTNVVDIPIGLKKQNLVAIATENANIAIYNIENENWNDWLLDLRENTGQTYKTMLAFADSEGFLKICDAEFRTNNKAKWFGFLNLNKTYTDKTFDNGGGNFYEDDFTPTPYTTNSTHVIVHHESNYDYSTSSPNAITFDQPHLGTYSPHISGMRLFSAFIDGTSSSSDLLEGIFTQKDRIKYYFVYTYEGGAISEPLPFTNSFGYPQSFAPQADNCALVISANIGKYLINADSNGDLFNVRLKSIQIFAQFSEYNPDDIYLMMEIDLNKGYKSEPTGSWSTLTEINDSNGDLNSYITHTDGSKNLPEVILYKTYPSTSFYSIYGIRYDIPIGFKDGGTGWKTHAIFNRRAYYGNVNIADEDGKVKNFPDGIVKSVLGKYDIVSSDNLIEATINDGDEITALSVVGNKLLQYKQNSLTVMSIKVLENGQSRETIEETFAHVGVMSDSQVVKTPYGVFWVSRSGIYTYNGQDLVKLTENLQGSTISKTEWENFYNDRTHVGYDAYWNQVHICEDVIDNPKTIIYSFNTRSFVETNSMYSVSQKTGFVNDTQGHLLWAEVGTGSDSIDNDTTQHPSKNNPTSQYNPPNQTP